MRPALGDNDLALVIQEYMDILDADTDATLSDLTEIGTLSNDVIISDIPEQKTSLRTIYPSNIADDDNDPITY